MRRGDAKYCLVKILGNDAVEVILSGNWEIISCRQNIVAKSNSVYFFAKTYAFIIIAWLNVILLKEIGLPYNLSIENNCDGCKIISIVFGILQLLRQN